MINLKNFNKILFLYFIIPIFFFKTYSVNLTESKIVSAIKNKYYIYDYIIVGVGTAGAVIARNLSNDLKTSVLGLQNGANLNSDPEIFLAANSEATVSSALFDNTNFYITGQTTDQAEADNRNLLWVLAKPLGGASAINASAYARPTNTTYNLWQAFAGPNWSASSMLNITKELEKYIGQTTNPAARGFNGPLEILQAPNPTLISQKFTQAITDATGFPDVLDYNDPNTPIGPSLALQYTHTGPNGAIRESSGSVFLNSTVMTPDGNGVNSRKLKILFNTTADKIIWENNKAVGVAYYQNGILNTARARKAVIISSGLFSSPILLRSGVGPKTLLDSLNIPVIFNNPNVGQNLADHFFIPLTFSTNSADYNNPIADPNNYLNQIAWFPDPVGDQTKRRFHFVTTNIRPDIALALLVLSPAKSRGSITINSTNPFDPPIINSGIFTNPDDLLVCKNALQIYIKNINNALQAIDPQYKLIMPDPAILSDDALVIDYLREATNSNEHFQSHCRMAQLNLGGVVDSICAVYGTQNLYVVDNSISPENIDGAPMSIAYFIASKFCQLILAK